MFVFNYQTKLTSFCKLSICFSCLSSKQQLQLWIEWMSFQVTDWQWTPGTSIPKHAKPLRSKWMPNIKTDLAQRTTTAVRSGKQILFTNQNTKDQEHKLGRSLPSSRRKTTTMTKSGSNWKVEWSSNTIYPSTFLHNYIKNFQMNCKTAWGKIELHTNRKGVLPITMNSVMSKRWDSKWTTWPVSSPNYHKRINQVSEVTTVIMFGGKNDQKTFKNHNKWCKIATAHTIKGG